MRVELSCVIERLAAPQHGLVTSEQARRALGPGRKDRWVAERRLVSVQPHVFRLADSPATWLQALMAGQLSTGGIVSHRSAAEMWGLIEPMGFVEVSVRRPRSPRARPPLVVHRIAALHPDRAVQRCGLAVTDPVRTVIDLGLVMPRSAVRDALSRGVTKRLFHIDEVTRLGDALGRPQVA